MYGIETFIWLIALIEYKLEYYGQYYIYTQHINDPVIAYFGWRSNICASWEIQNIHMNPPLYLFTARDNFYKIARDKNKRNGNFRA